MEASVLIEIKWPFKGDDDPDWLWCVKNANFVHRDRDACEFIIHAGDDYYDLAAENMHKGGCSDGFVTVYINAKKMGATRVLFWS